MFVAEHMQTIENTDTRFAPRHQDRRFQLLQWIRVRTVSQRASYFAEPFQCRGLLLTQHL